MLETYDELVSEIEAYLGRNDSKIVARIPGFIRRAELRINRQARMRCMECTATALAVGGTPELALPNVVSPVSDWDVFIDMRRVGIAGQPEPLGYIPPLLVNGATGTGLPTRYTIKGKTLVLSPTPDGEYTVEMDYYSSVPPLSVDNPSNEVLLEAPDLYLFGALSASCSYTRNTERQAEWEAQFQAALGDITQSEDKARFTPTLSQRPIRRI